MADNTINIEKAFMIKVKNFTNITLKKKAKDMQDYAKDKAEVMEAGANFETIGGMQRKPWIHRTGKARKMIKGVAFSEDDAIGIKLMHRVEYGEYLEMSNDRKYAILEPTCREFMPEIKELARKYFGG